MEATICIRKDAIVDLVKVKNKFGSIVESLELMADNKFMDSYNRSKEQIKERVWWLECTKKWNIFCVLEIYDSYDIIKFFPLKSSQEILRN